MRLALLCLVTLAVGCSSDPQSPGSDTLGRKDGAGDPWGEAGSPPDQRIGGDHAAGIEAGSTEIKGEDSCPPTGAPVTADMTISGATKTQLITGFTACGSLKPFAQVIAVKLVRTMKIQLKVTVADAVTSLSVRPDCTTYKGCKAGEAKNGMTYEVTREAGTHYVVVGTGAPAAYQLEIKLVDAVIADGGA